MATNSQHQETPEYCIFREHYDRLYHAIQDPLSLATRLFTRSIITSAVTGRMIAVGLSTLEKNGILLSAVEMQIRTDPRMFYEFLSALNEDPSMQSLVESMQRELSSGAHGGDESRDGGEEQEKNSMSLVPGLEGLSICGESMTLPRHVDHQHYQHHRLQRHPQHQNRYFHHSSSQPPSKSIHNASFHPPPLQVWHHPPNQGRPPIQPRMYQPPNYPFQPPLGQPSYEHSDPVQPLYYQPSHHPPNPPLLQHTHPPSSQTPHQQPHYQPNYQMPVQPVYTYQPPYQHPFSHRSPLSLHKYHHPEYYQTSTVQLPTFQTPSHSYQAHFQAPVQPIYPYQSPSQPARLPASQLPPPPPLDSPLGKHALFLRGYYTQHQAPCTKWPQLHTRKYINLAVINNVYANRADLVQFREQTIHGSIDDILEWKAPIRMKNILRPNCVYDIHDEKHEHHPVTQLLIEGAPGIGKSTFAWEVCQKWGHHQLFNEYSLVVLLRFRDKRVQVAKSVSDLFYYPLPEVQSDIIRDIVLSGGHGLLLILEGFDEAPPSKRTMDSIFVRLFTGQEFPNATVILTTRPSASAELRQLCKGKHSRRIEIVGFGKKEIDEYIQCAFSDEQSQSDFKEYLSLYPHIHSMMYVPLNSAIVTHVYESGKSSGAVVPKTMTQLYSSLIRTLLLHYLNDKEEYKDTCTNINSFKDLPQPVYEQFCEICKIAHTGIMSAETELIFQDLRSDFDPLGLMQSCPELYVDRGASVSYNFLHLTIQEYLAAYHISQQSRDELLAFMREHLESKKLWVAFMREHLKSEKWVPFMREHKKLEVVVRFLAGLSELGRDLWDVVRGFASDDQHNIRLEILHLLFESQDLSAITSVLGSGCVSFACYSELPFDWYVLGHCIAHSSCEWKLQLKGCKLESVELFLRALNLHQDQCQLSSTGKIKEMWLSESDSAAVNLLVDNMSHMSVFDNLTHLGLIGCYLTSESCNLLSKHTNLLQHLEYLDLSANPDIGRGGAVNLITSLTKFSTIRDLHLWNAGIGFEDCKALSELLASSKYIEVLDISDNKLSSDSVQLIVDGLSHNTSLEKLDMSCSNFSSQNVFKLASVLRANTRLKELKIGRWNIQSSDSVHLAEALEENTTTQLHTLWLWGNSIGSEGAVALADMLTTNKSLAKLNMDYCSIQGEGAVCLAKAMEKNSTLREFDISDNPIGSEGAVAFASMLATNKSLAKLNMRWCSIQGEGAICLAKALENNSTLKELHISIGSEGAVAFASMLKKNQCLKTLDLRHDSVGVEGALELIESLKHNTTLEKLELLEKCKPSSFSTLDKTLQDRVKFSYF